MGNKGALIAKMNFDTFKFCFINCHLNAGKKSDDRIYSLIEILLKAYKNLSDDKEK